MKCPADFLGKTNFVPIFGVFQHAALRGLAEFTTGGGNADEDQMVNWFDVVTKKHMNELGLLIKNA